MPNKFELLSGPAVQTALTEADAQVFRYTLNPAGLYIAFGLALVFYIGGALCYFISGLGGFMTVLFVALMFAGVGFTTLAAYWHQFASQQLVAVSEDRLFVGGPKATWAIAWELLDRRSMGFEELQMTRLRGALRLQVGGQTIPLHLFNMIAYLADIEGFMHGVLTRLQLPEGEVPAELGEEE